MEIFLTQSLELLESQFDSGTGDGLEEIEEQSRGVQSPFQFRVEEGQFDVVVQFLQPFELRRVGLGAQLGVYLRQFSEKTVGVLSESSQRAQEVKRAGDLPVQDRNRCFQLDSLDLF